MPKVSKIIQKKSEVLSNLHVKGNYYKLALNLPEIVRFAQPGQFVMLRISNDYQPLLRRPFSIHSVGDQKSRHRNKVEILYEVVGKGTKILSEKKPGEYIDILGPLGNGFSILDARFSIIVAGGMGVAPLFFLAPRFLRRSEADISPSKAFEYSLINTLSTAEKLNAEGDYKGALENAIRAVDMKIRDVGLKFGIKQNSYITLDILEVHPYIRNDYWLLINSLKSGYKTQNDAFRGIITARYIIRELEKVENKLYATNTQRIVAFLIDTAIIVGIVISFFYLGGVLGVYDLNEILSEQSFIWFLALIMWLWIAQIIYFTFFEGWKGQSPGKKLIGIKVTNDELQKCDFLDAFTRNVVRFLDIVLFIYAVSLLVMNLYPKRQRIGDLVAKTVVLKG